MSIGMHAVDFVGFGAFDSFLLEGGRANILQIIPNSLVEILYLCMLEVIK